MSLRSISSIIFLVTAINHAQTNETLNGFGSIGYGFGTGGQLFSSSKLSTDIDGNKKTTERKDKYFNYGQGLKFDFGIQYFMMEKVALQAGLCYSGGVPSLESSYSERDSINALILDSTDSYHHQLFGIKVMAVPRIEILELMNIHTGVGIGLFWNSLKYEIVRKSPTETKSENGSIKSYPTLGLVGLVGADYPLTDLMSLYGEISFEQMSFKWKERVIANSQLKRSTGVYNYGKNVPNQEPPLRIPGSNWRIGFGVRYVIM